MSATIQPKGNKLYVVVDVHDENGKRKQKWISTGLDINGNKRKAEEIRKEIEREYEVKNRLFPSEVYLDEFTQRWINAVRSDVDVITYGGYENIVRAHIIPYFKKHRVKVNEVTPDIMQAYFDEMKTKGNKNTGKGLSPKSLRSHLNVFRQIFKLARKEKIIFDDPSEFVKLPKNTPQKVEVYDSETLKKVFEAIKDDRLFHLIYVTLFFGMRRSEALGIRWDAVDFENKTLTVKHTVVAYNGKVVAKDSTKTDSSNRTYPLSDEMVSMFRWLKNREEEERKLCGSDYIENDYVFKWPNGKPFEPDYVSKHFKKLLKKNNFKHIRFHALRHSCAGLLLSDGYELYDVMEWLGHSDIGITAKFYGHLDMKRKKVLGSSIGNAIGIDSGNSDTPKKVC